MIKAKINGIPVEVPEGTTILEAAHTVEVRIPTLCKHKEVAPTASCGICIVKLANSPKLLRACCTPVEEGMDILTQDPEIVSVRKNIVELILSAHPNDCLYCGRNGSCELQDIAAEFGIREVRFPNVSKKLPMDVSTGSIVLNPEKCIRCGRCLEVCQHVQDVWALTFLDRGINTRMAPAGDITLDESPCVNCGQCSAHCPVGAIFEYDETQKVWDALMDEKNHCVVQIAPAVRVAIGEAFGLEPGTNLTGKLYAMFRRMGFKAVFDTNFGADVTIMEEANEFVSRFTKAPESLPLITTCCPSWVEFMEKKHNDMIPHFSSCKSPQEITGVLTKTYYAQQKNIDPATIFSVSIMPCTAKKAESARDETMYASGYKDVDVALTTRELARMIKQAGVDFLNLPDEAPDHILGDYTGAGVIFGATGGVMEAALRTAYNVITGKDPKDVAFKTTRGLKGIKESEIDIKGTKVRIAVAHGLGNVETALTTVREAKAAGKEPPYHFIEIMACPGGCVGGGGQPYGICDELREKRMQGLYADDEAKTIRCSHENPYVKELYKKFLGEPNGHKAEELLHTKYVALPDYVK